MCSDLVNPVRWKSRLVSAALIPLLLASPLRTAVQPGAITGRIVDPVPMALEGVSIKIVSENSPSRSYSGQTDDQGYFCVNGASAGRYYLEASLRGFRNKIVRYVRVIAGASKDLGSVQMQLAPCDSHNGPICDVIQ